MKKFFFYFFAVILTAITLFFITNISLQFYFNRFLYETPNLSNLTLEEAEIIAKKGKFKIMEMGTDYSELPKGHIYTQIPEFETPVKKGRILKVWTSKGEDRIILPDLSKHNLEDARVELEKLGLTLGSIAYTNKDNVLFNQVVATEPKKGNLIYKNQKVSLLINMKTTGKVVRIPDLIGLDTYEVKRILKKKKLILGTVSYIENPDLQEDVVVNMNYEFGEEVPEGTVIDITINK